MHSEILDLKYSDRFDHPFILPVICMYSVYRRIRAGLSHDVKEFQVSTWQISLSGTESVNCGSHVTDRRTVIRRS
jgi:hypothetical protein